MTTKSQTNAQEPEGNDFWSGFEVVINNFGELEEQLTEAMDKVNKNEFVFAWRGQKDASWPLHSSLYRRLKWTNENRNPTEEELQVAEDKIMRELHRWGLHHHPTRGRLSYLNQLAILQHYGAPTRLIDITFNAWVGVFFAVEEDKENGNSKYEDKDARLFAIDIESRIINEIDEVRPWEDSYRREWSPEKLEENKSMKRMHWTSKVYAWEPPSIDSRIFAQNGAFLLGGVPRSVTEEGESNFQVPKNKAGEFWSLDETRDATSVAIRPHKFIATRGQVRQNACFTFRIKAHAKKEIRERLETMFGYKHSTIYPDYSGFSSFATQHLYTEPPETKDS